MKTKDLATLIKSVASPGTYLTVRVVELEGEVRMLKSVIEQKMEAVVGAARPPATPMVTKLFGTLPADIVRPYLQALEEELLKRTDGMAEQDRNALRVSLNKRVTELHHKGDDA